MKPVKISYSIISTSPLLIIYFMLFAFKTGEPLSIKAFSETIYRKYQNYPENNNLTDTTQNNSSTLIFSNPFHLSNATLMLGKTPVEKSSTINREIQFFVERGVINTSLVTYNVGYYVEDSNMDGSNSDPKPLSIDRKTESGPNYAKGLGILLTENVGIFEWDAFDQIISKSDDKILYAGMIFLSPTTDKNDELSFLKNPVGLYKFSIDNDTTFSLNSIIIIIFFSIHRTIWLWPYTY